MTDTTPQFNYLEVEAALCVWECINEWTLLLGDTGKPDWIELREGVGSVELRHQSIAIGQWCLKVYDLCTKDDPDFFDAASYDWEVIPMILGHAMPKENMVELPDVETTAAMVMLQHATRE